MAKGKKTYEWLKAHSKSKEKISVVAPFCVNSQGTFTNDQLAALLTMASHLTQDFQIFTEDNTSNYNLSLMSLESNHTVNDIEPKVLMDAKKTGTPILVKTAENSCFIYGNQNGKWDFVEAEFKEEDLNRLPFDKKILYRQDELFSSVTHELEKAHVPYYKQWVTENKNELDKYSRNDIHALRQTTLWNTFKDAYLAYRGQPENRDQITKKLKKDRQNVLSSHPSWGATVDDHILYTAIDWAVLHMSDQPKQADAVTYIWYPHEATKTGNDALQFARENAEALGLTMKNAVHFEFDITNLIEEYSEINKQENKSMPALKQDSEPKSSVSLTNLDDKQFSGLHADVKEVLRDAFLTALKMGDSQLAIAVIFTASDACHQKSRENSPPRTSNTVIYRGLQGLQQEEMKTYSPPTISPLREFSSSRVTNYPTTFNRKNCSSEEKTPLVVTPLVPLSSPTRSRSFSGS